MEKMNQFIILICDDDIYAFDNLKKLLINTSMFTDAQYFYSHTKDDAIEIYKNADIDLVFMDIELGENLGFNIIKELLDNGYSPQVVYITNYSHYVFDAFIGQPIGFIRKQNIENDLDIVLSEIHRVFDKKLKSIDILCGTTKYTLKLSEIVAFEVFIHNLNVYYFDGKELTVRYTLKLLETELLNYDFVRISRNALINLHYVKSVTKDLIVMKNGQRFYISSRKLTDIKNAINAFNEDKKC